MIFDEKLVIAMSAIACVFSLTVITVCVTIIDISNKRFNKIIFFIAISDFFANVANMFGFPANGSVLCWVQGLMTIFFSRCSWGWTIFLCHSIYSVVKYGRFYYSMSFAHKMVWGIALVLTLGPVSTTNIGQVEEMPQWCIRVAREGNPWWVEKLWSTLWLFTWFVLAVGSMTVMQVIIHFKFKKSQVLNNDVIKTTYDKIWLYPVVLMVCQIIYFLTNVISLSRLYLTIGMISINMYTILTASIFLCKSNETQQKFLYLLAKNGCLLPSRNADTTTSTSIIYIGSRDVSKSLSRDEEIPRTITQDFVDDAEFQGLLDTLRLSESSWASSGLADSIVAATTNANASSKSNSPVEVEGRSYNTNGIGTSRFSDVKRMASTGDIGAFGSSSLRAPLTASASNRSDDYL